jgi:dual specificity protein kinase YAK1
VKSSPSLSKYVILSFDLLTFLINNSFQPNGHTTAQISQVSPATGNADPKRPYGGLVPQQPKGTRAFQDAASYNQQLAQHQAYTAQAQAASQAANNVFRNPYAQQQQQQQQQPPSQTQQSQQQPPPPPLTYQPPQGASTPVSYPAQQPQQHTYSSSQPAQLSSLNPPSSGYSQGTGLSVPGMLNPNPPASSHYAPPHARARANTINHSDMIPPALARLQHMNQDVIAGRNALTPVLNRDDAMREWERRQAGKPSAAQPYPQLEYLQQQAELAAANGMSGWSASNRYPPPTSKLAHSYQPTIVVDDDRREAVMSNVRSAARGDAGASGYNSAAMVTSPTQAYAGNSTGTGARYPATFSSQQQAANPPFDPLSQRTDIGALYVPMQPEQYQSYAGAGATQGAAMPSARQAPQTAQPAQSFYGPGVPSAVQAPPQAAQRNPFNASEASQQTKEARRMSGMDVWSR